MPDDWYDHPLKKLILFKVMRQLHGMKLIKSLEKEARDVIGPEQRDPAAIDRYDTTRFQDLA